MKIIKGANGNSPPIHIAGVIRPRAISVVVTKYAESEPDTPTVENAVMLSMAPMLVDCRSAQPAEHAPKITAP
jgi:hypothetical protein